jgi:hypothetical protein
MDLPLEVYLTPAFRGMSGVPSTPTEATRSMRACKPEHPHPKFRKGREI